jgi:NTE family protein
MSAPGVFVPVERDGRLLVDGGIANNVPIDVIRAMNVDLLIVVDVGFPLSSRDRLASVTSVANQMLAILIRRESEKQVATLGLGDVLISPDMPQISSFDFGSLPKATVAGEAATLAVRERLAMLALPPDQYERYLAQRNHPGHVPVVRNVRVQADSVAFARPVDALFGDLAGIRLDVPELNRRSNRYYGQGLIESLDYQLEPVQDGEPGSTADLLFSVHANPWGPNYVRFGLRIQDDFAGNSTFDAAAQVLFTDINSNGAEWQWEGQVGGNPRFGSALYLPFSQRRRWFVEPSVLLQIREVPEFQNEEQVGELRVRSLRLGTDLGREIGQSAEVRAGLAREFDRSRVRLGDSQGQQQNFTSNEYFLRYTLDDLDSVAFPRQGHALTLEWRGHLSEQFVGRVSDAVRIDWLEARSWGRNTVIAWASAGTLLDDKFADSRSYFPLGGFLQLSGLSADSLVGPHFGVARLIYFRKIGYGGEGFLNVPLYAGMSVEAGNTWQQRTDMTLHSARKDASLFFGMDTFLGPAWLAAGFDSSGRQAFYLSLGRGL